MVKKSADYNSNIVEAFWIGDDTDEADVSVVLPQNVGHVKCK